MQDVKKEVTTMKNRMTVKEAAKEMEVCQQFVREGLKAGRLPFGTAVKRAGSTKYAYYINPEQFKKYMAGEIIHYQFERS